MRIWLPYAAVFLYGVACALNLFGCTPPERRRLRIISKCFLMPLLALCYLLLARIVSPLVVLALFFGFAGDVLLLFSERKSMFAGGLAAFALGHVCYVLYLMRLIGTPPAWWLAALLALPYVLLILLIMRALKPHLPRGFLPPCLGYMILLGFMSYCALLVCLSRFSLYAALAFIGSLFFIASDTVLAANNFGLRQYRRRNLIVMASYLLAQTLLVTGLLYM